MLCKSDKPFIITIIYLYGCTGSLLGSIHKVVLFLFYLNCSLYGLRYGLALETSRFDKGCNTSR